MQRAHTPRPSPHTTRPRTWRRHVALFGLLAAVTVGLSAQPSRQGGRAGAGDAPSRPFRHYPGGKDLQGQRLARTAAAAADALRAEGDSQLPDGFNIRADAEPVMAPAGGNRVFRFRLEHRGVPLAASSDFVAIVDGTGRLLASRLRRVPDAVDALAPTATAAAAIDSALTHARATRSGSTPLVAGDATLEIWVDDAGHGYLTWSMLVRSARTEPGHVGLRYRISALDGTRVFAVEDVTRDATVHVQAEMWQLSPELPTVIAPLTDARVTANGSGLPVLTDTDGNVVFPGLPPGASVSATLRGPYADVRSNGSSQSLSATIVATGGDDPLTFIAATEFTRAQTTAFFWTTHVNRWVRARLPFLNRTSTVLDAIEVNVNITLSCNAFSTGDSIAFGRASGGCQNMATPTVVAHEFGHSIHFALATDAFDVPYSEGFGDGVAALVSDQPCIGVGVAGPGSCIRDLTAVTTWPVTSDDPHQIGEPYGQFVWALRQSLGNEPAAQLLLASAAVGPDDIPDAVHLSFVMDDDDGLLGTCSPNQRALEAAADSRLLPRPQTCRAAGDNRTPSATDDTLVLVEDAGATPLDLLSNDTDPDGDRLEVGDVVPGQLGRVTCGRAGCQYTPNADAHGTDIFSYTAVDTFGGSATATVRVEIVSVEDPPQIFGPFPVESAEGDPVPVAVSAVDPDGPGFTLQWMAGEPGAPAPCTFADPQAASTTMTCAHEGHFAFGVVVTQGGVPLAGPLAVAEIANVRPSVTMVSPSSGSTSPATATVDVVATFDEGPVAGPHTCEVTWGDGTVSAGVVAGGACTASHAFASGSAGQRQILVTVVDPGGARGAATVTVTVSAPSGSPCHDPRVACATLGAGLLGPARAVAFEFSAWSLRGRIGGQFVVIDGARFRLVASAVQSLDIVGQAAVIRGTGAVNGRTGYSFEAYAQDRPAARDTLRVVVRDRLGVIVHDVGGEVTRGDLATVVVR